MLTLKPITLAEDQKRPEFSNAVQFDLFTTYAAYYEKIGFKPPWVGYFIMQQNQVVGTCGFTGKPNGGRVEIAYWTFPEFQGNGIASFACKELIVLSKNADPKVIITAKTSPEHNASTKILQRNGFEFQGIVNDDDIGVAWEWIHLSK
jgi:ribosomal-protein-alanine N-acetyltransferase